MSSYSTSIQLARRIWPRLVALAASRSTITYQELGVHFGITGRALQNFDRILAPIKHYCLQHKLPPLSALVVRKESGLPGSGAEADETDIEAVFAFDWRSRSPAVPSEAELLAAVDQAKRALEA